MEANQLEPMKYKEGDRVMTQHGPGTVVWAADDEKRAREPHEEKDAEGKVLRSSAWPKLYHVEIDPVPPAKKGSTFSFHESELRELSAPDPSPPTA